MLTYKFRARLSPRFVSSASMPIGVAKLMLGTYIHISEGRRVCSARTDGILEVGIMQQDRITVVMEDALAMHMHSGSVNARVC